MSAAVDTAIVPPAPPAGRRRRSSAAASGMVRVTGAPGVPPRAATSLDRARRSPGGHQAGDNDNSGRSSVRIRQRRDEIDERRTTSASQGRRCSTMKTSGDVGLGRRCRRTAGVDPACQQAFPGRRCCTSPMRSRRRPRSAPASRADPGARRRTIGAIGWPTSASRLTRDRADRRVRCDVPAGDDHRVRRPASSCSASPAAPR